MALQKAYNVKIYDLSGSFERVLTERKIMNEVSFSGQLGGGQGEVSIQLAESVDSDIVAYNNLIRIYESDTQNDGVLIYTGIVTNIVRISESGREYIEVEAVGLSSMLTRLYFFQSGYTFTKNQEIALTIKNVVDYFSTVYPGLISYTGTSIENTGVIANYSFQSVKCLDSIKKVSAGSTYSFYIGADGVFHYHPKTGGIGEITHFLTVGKDIESINIEESAEEVVNKYIIAWQSGDVTSQDVTSQGTYGLRELIESDTSITNSGTATAFADAYITDNKDAKRKIRIVVNSEYNIETIRPGDLVTVRNFDYDITSLKIQKIEYNSEKITLELEQITSLAQEIARI